MNRSELSRRVGIAPEQATRAMKGLRERELVETGRSEENRRMVIAQITDKGALTMDEHLRLIEENLKGSLDALSDEEVDRLAAAAQTTVALMRKTGLKHIVPDPGLCD